MDGWNVIYSYFSVCICVYVIMHELINMYTSKVPSLIAIKTGHILNVILPQRVIVSF